MRDTTPSTDSNHNSNTSSKLGRRSFLGALGATAAGASLLTSGTAAASHVEDRYDRIIDIVDDAGADNSGDESITPILEQYAADDTLLKFPPGRYFMDSQFRFTGFENFGMVGDDATLVPANYHNFDGPQYRLFRLGVDYDPGVDLRVQGFAVDLRADDTGIRVIEAEVTDGLFVDDITVVGRHDSGTFGPGLFNILSADGKGMVKRFRANDGGAFSENAPGDIWRGPSGLMTSKSHVGQLEFKDCELTDWPDNGLYTPSEGRVIVNGGRFANSEAASIRMSGHDCLITGAEVVVDQQHDENQNQRGIRLDGGSDLRVDDTTIRLEKPNGHALTVMDDVESAWLSRLDVHVGDEVNHGIVVQSNAGSTKITRSDIEIQRGGNAIQINGSDAGAVICKHLDITGDAEGYVWPTAIRSTRNNCVFHNVNYNQTGDRGRKAMWLDGVGSRVSGGQQTTAAYPFVVKGSDLLIENLNAQSVDGYEAIQLSDQSSDVTIRNSDIERGVEDNGCAGLEMYGNDTS
ncbi:right-handed parallel beta-helix repeat-containing protein [Haladaptatus sp. CMSO5]|uniref:right-handed parallel beta-helix repeat-containing protein n=1 Tax=Haladaptatus sp. CMSO5 TaxID=3120514 RepID=UPI002FCE6433